MKIKAGNNIIPIFEKKKATPIQGSGFPGSQPMGQRPVFRPGPSLYPGVGGIKKEKPKDITKVIANLPKDELTAYVSVILGLIFIFIAIIIW